MVRFENKKIFFAIDAKINKQYLNKYIAVLVHKTDKKGTLYYIRTEEIDMNSKIPHNLYEEINTFEQLKDYDIYPLPNMDDDDQMRRSVVYAVGQAGSGKTTLSAIFAKMYHLLYPTSEIFYFTMNPAKNERAFTEYEVEHIIKRVDVNKFADNWIKENEKGELYNDDSRLKNSLQIFDDLDVLEGDRKKSMWKYITFINESLRKLNVSCYVMAHIPTDGLITRKFLKEIKIYVIYPFLNRRACQYDRVLYAYLQYKRKEVELICNLPSRWIWLNETKRVIITENQIFSSDILNDLIN